MLRRALVMPLSGMGLKIMSADFEAWLTYFLQRWSRPSWAIAFSLLCWGVSNKQLPVITSADLGTSLCVWNHKNNLIFFFKFFEWIYLFIFACTESSLLLEGFSRCRGQAFHFGDLLQSMCRRCRLVALHSLWSLLGPRIEPASSAWAGSFLTTAPPRKSKDDFLTILLNPKI